MGSAKAAPALASPAMALKPVANLASKGISWKASSANSAIRTVKAAKLLLSTVPPVILGMFLIAATYV